jgi:DNA primase
MDSDRRQFIDDVKRDNPIAEVAARYTHLKRRGRHLFGLCPFHSERTASFSVRKDTGTWYCFGACGLGGDVIDLVGTDRFGRSWNSHNREMFDEALSLLSNSRLPPLKHPVPADWKDATPWKPIELEPAVQLALDLAARIYHTTLLELGRGPDTPYHYLRSRGLSDATIRSEGIGYVTGNRLAAALMSYGLSRDMAVEVNLINPDHGYREFLKGRIVFVDRDRSGRVLHMIGRRFPSLPDKDPYKYLSLAEMSKPLHGYARLDRRQSGSPIIVVESPPDRLTARQWGFDAVANIGTGLKPDHAVQLARIRRPKIIVPHNDGGTGWEAALRWYEQIGPLVTIARLPDAVKDLNELAQLEGAQHLFNEIVAAALEKFEPGDECLPAGEHREVAHESTRGSLNLWIID